MALPSQQQLAAVWNVRAAKMTSFYFRWSKLSVQAHKGTSSANVAINPLLKYKNLVWLMYLSQKIDNTIWKSLENIKMAACITILRQELPHLLVAHFIYLQLRESHLYNKLMEVFNKHKPVFC